MRVHGIHRPNLRTAVSNQATIVVTTYIID